MNIYKATAAFDNAGVQEMNLPGIRKIVLITIAVSALGAGGAKIALKKAGSAELHPSRAQLEQAHRLITSESKIAQHNSQMVRSPDHIEGKQPGEWKDLIPQPIDEHNGTITVPLLFLEPHLVPSRMIREDIRHLLEQNGLTVRDFKVKGLSYTLRFPEGTHASAGVKGTRFERSASAGIFKISPLSRPPFTPVSQRTKKPKRTRNSLGGNGRR